MPSYIMNQAAVCGCLEELKVDLMVTRVCTPGWDITVIAKIPQKRITMKMKVGVILGQQLAIQADRFLEIETIDESCYPVTDSRLIIREQEAVVACYLCAMCGHTSVDCPKLKSGGPWNKVDLMSDW